MSIAALDLGLIREARAHDPAAIGRALATRRRRPLLGSDGRLLIVAADHPARGAVGVGADATAMADRGELLRRLAVALADPGVDGVLATPDIVDDLALLGLLDDKVVVGSMNRGGLRGSVFEFDDRFTSYDPASLAASGLDAGKLLVRIALDDPATAGTLEATARVLGDAAAIGMPIMVEPFLSRWERGAVRHRLDADSVALSVAIAGALGSSSSATWLKLPVVPEMERVMAATTMPTLLLGGELGADADATFASWHAALGLPGVRGLMVGRNLLYPADGDVAAAVRTAARLVHAGAAA